jgi:hypothetical protein
LMWVLSLILWPGRTSGLFVIGVLSEIASRVENRRNDGSLPVGA